MLKRYNKGKTLSDLGNYEIKKIIKELDEFPYVKGGMYGRLRC